MFCCASPPRRWSEPSGRGSRDKALHDLYFGEALYYAQQGHYFEALERLDAELGQHRALDEPELDTLHYHLHDAEFSVGDFELNYRMHHRAGRAIKAVLEGAVDEHVRNEAAYRLARIHFQKGQLDDALAALERIQGQVPEAIRDDVEFLRANVYLGLGRPDDAVKVLRRLQGAASLKGFAAYNLGIALLDAGHEQEAIEQLDRRGRCSGGGEPVLAIRDKSNMVLGTDAGRVGPVRAREAILRPRASRRAVLEPGVARAGLGRGVGEHYERAVVPWGILAARETTDCAVQEAKLAVPFAYGKLERATAAPR